jgi:hypothetical protein
MLITFVKGYEWIVNKPLFLIIKYNQDRIWDHINGSCSIVIFNEQSSQEKNKKNNDLEQSQNNQSEVGNAENNPETECPSENLREEALETTNNESDQKEPA